MKTTLNQSLPVLSTPDHLNTQITSTRSCCLYQSIVPCLEQSRSQLCQFLWSVTCICLPFSQNIEAVTIPPLFYQERESSLELKNQQQAEQLIEFANEVITKNKESAFSYLLQATKLHYSLAASTLTSWIENDLASKNDFSSFFTSLQKTLDNYRYIEPSLQKEKIKNLIKVVDPLMATDVSVLIDLVIDLLKKLEIKYHNIQHTLEVTLGVTQTVVERFKEQRVKNLQEELLLPIVAALFHDIAYSNTPEMLSLIKNLSPQEYTPLFFAAKGENFIEDFEDLAQTIDIRISHTGAEMHLYHVLLSQIVLPFILNKLPETFEYKEFLLEESSLEKIKAMISLTDIKPDPKKYREERRSFLASHNLLEAGESLKTSDLLTQLSTSNRLSKDLPLYHEMFLGNDSSQWNSGLALISSSPDFYEYFAKKQFNPEVLFTLDNYFTSLSLNENPYRIGLSLIFFFHQLFKPIYQKLLSIEPITNQDLQLLEELQKNGLQEEVVCLFRAAKYTRENTPIPKPLKNFLHEVIRNKSSILEISIGDEIRMTLFRNAALSQDMEAAIYFLSLRKPGILIDRSHDFIASIELLQNHPNFEKLAKLVKKILNNTSNPKELKNYLTLKNKLKLIFEIND